MSLSLPGGFTGGDALLAFAAVQQGRWNEQMSDAMALADLRSQMAQDITDIKTHLQSAHENPQQFPELNQELQAFMAKYGHIPELQQATAAVGEIADNLQAKMGQAFAATHAPAPSAAQSYNANTAAAPTGGGFQISGGSHPSSPSHPTAAASQVSQAPTVGLFNMPVTYSDEQIQGWLDQLTGTLDACGTSDELNMIYIKQLNDRVNNSSGMVSGIIESRANATASIINHIA